MIIQAELRISIERPLRSLPIRHSVCFTVQQHPTQFSHWAGTVQPSQEFSVQPHDWQEEAISAKEKRLPADRSPRLIKLVPDRGGTWTTSGIGPGSVLERLRDTADSQGGEEG